MECYTILGVPIDATQDQIRKAYHAKALQHHPDRKAHAKKDCTFSKISHAFSILSDKKKRSEYDAAMNLGRQAAFLDEEGHSTKLTELEGNESFRALQWMKRVDDKQYVLRHLGRWATRFNMPTGALDFEPVVSPCMCADARPHSCSCMPSIGPTNCKGCGGAEGSGAEDASQCGAIVCLAPDLLHHEPQAKACQRHHVYLCVKHRVVHACDDRCTKLCKTSSGTTAAKKILRPASELTFSDWEDDGVDHEEMVRHIYIIL